MMLMNLDLLPDDCISRILTLTSPRDACKTALTSHALRRAADSDLVWEDFLPGGYRDVLSRSVFPLLFNSKKELFLRLCNPLLIDGGIKAFSIERSTSKKCFMISARQLSISWAREFLNWSWKPYTRSRFGEVVEITIISWLELYGTINTQTLSPNTVYGAYLVINFADRISNNDGITLAEDNNLDESRRFHFLRHIQLPRLESTHEHIGISSVLNTLCVSKGREDGWLEIELGEFESNGAHKELNVSLKEVVRVGDELIKEVIVEGIEVRPK